MNEISISKRHLNNIAADIRCREQLMNQREFGSDQTFPSVSFVCAFLDDFCGLIHLTMQTKLEIDATTGFSKIWPKPKAPDSTLKTQRVIR